jgi:hypothetical protein
VSGGPASRAGGRSCRRCEPASNGVAAAVAASLQARRELASSGHTGLASVWRCAPKVTTGQFVVLLS